jgi:hypothetical protein
MFAQTSFTDEAICGRRICASIDPVDFWGYVEADAGVSRVALQIRCQNTGQYWNGTGWSSDSHEFRTKLDQPNGLVSRWHFSFDTRKYSALRSSNLSARNVLLSLIAVDTKNRKTVSKNTKQFSLAFADPNTCIDSWQYDPSEKQLLSVSGRANDIKTIRHVRISLQHPVTREYWNGDRWQKEHIHLDTSVSSLDGDPEYSHQWSLDVPVPPVERILVVAKAFNQSLNFDRTPAINSVILAGYDSRIRTSQAK